MRRSPNASAETPMHDRSRAGDIARYSFLVMFANDRVIDSAELAFVERLALADGVVDEAEKAALRAIFARVDPDALGPAVAAEIAAFRTRFDI